MRRRPRGRCPGSSPVTRAAPKTPQRAPQRPWRPPLGLSGRSLRRRARRCVYQFRQVLPASLPCPQAARCIRRPVHSAPCGSVQSVESCTRGVARARLWEREWLRGRVGSGRGDPTRSARHGCVWLVDARFACYNLSLQPPCGARRASARVQFPARCSSNGGRKRNEKGESCMHFSFVPLVLLLVLRALQCSLRYLRCRCQGASAGEPAGAFKRPAIDCAESASAEAKRQRPDSPLHVTATHGAAVGSAPAASAPPTHPVCARCLSGSLMLSLCALRSGCLPKQRDTAPASNAPPHLRSPAPCHRKRRRQRSHSLRRRCRLCACLRLCCRHRALHVADAACREHRRCAGGHGGRSLRVWGGGRCATRGFCSHQSTTGAQARRLRPLPEVPQQRDGLRQARAGWEQVSALPRLERKPDSFLHLPPAAVASKQSCRETTDSCAGV